MARFAVHKQPGKRGYLLDCQTDYLAGLDTRLMVPLFLIEDFGRPAARLNPVFLIGDETVVMMTQYAAALQTRHIGPLITSLADEQDVIVAAIDMLLTGF